MLIRNIEQKIKLALVVSLGSFLTAIMVVALIIHFAHQQVAESRKKIYVLDGDVPLMVRQTTIEANRKVEYLSHINQFHSLFFNLPPDDAYIQANLERAMYLVDESGLKEYNNLKEKGYYNSILASSAVLSIRTDSIQLDAQTRSFRYYATQRIERKTSVLIRQLITEGLLKDVPRTVHNPHGCLILNWKTVLNKDISHTRKSNF